MYSESFTRLAASDGKRSAIDADRLLASARSLRQTHVSGAIQPLLRGRNFGLLSESTDTAPARTFRLAAEGLGAQVTHLRPSQSRLATLADVKQAASMLGRLYAAIECQGVAPEVVQHLAHHAGVPVFADLSTGHFPTRVLARQLDQEAPGQDNCRYILQATLLACIDL